MAYGDEALAMPRGRGECLSRKALAVAGCSSVLLLDQS